MLRVTSEVGRLRSVLMHAPGREIDLMVPSMMEELLFDDILFGEAAREEHRLLVETLTRLGVEVVEMRDLLVEILGHEEARKHVLEPLVDVVPAAVAERMTAAPAEELADLVIHGVRVDPTHPGIEPAELFEIPPVPNLCFQRDPHVVVHGGVIVSSMATAARWREALLSSSVFRFHPRFREAEIVLDPMSPRYPRPLHLGSRRHHFEGGDFLVLSRDIVLLGHSQRTNRTGVQHVLRALGRIPDGPRWLILVTLPDERAFMHLDTVFTPIDRDACLVHAPIIYGHHPDVVGVYEFDLHSRDRLPSACDDLLSALKRHGVDFQPITCGGDDAMMQQREQWTDGANALALAPGIITIYDRNVATAEELARHGFEVHDVQALLERLRAGERPLDLDAPRRACILLPSHEISRARGGPHCLTHPLVRDDLAP